jgi:hypothetical protein
MYKKAADFPKIISRFLEFAKNIFYSHRKWAI